MTNWTRGQSAPDGSIADVCGHVVWVALAGPAVGDPGLRHDIGRQRAFLANDDGTFTDLGLVFDVNNPVGARRWAGSIVLDGNRLYAYYTAVGIAGADPPGFRQRPAVATGMLSCHEDEPRFDSWSDHVELFEPDPRWYDSVDQIEGAPGIIKAFRDPFPFLDPATGSDYLFVTSTGTDSVPTANCCRCRIATNARSASAEPSRPSCTYPSMATVRGSRPERRETSTL